jgi:hypothetical protein
MPLAQRLQLTLMKRRLQTQPLLCILAAAAIGLASAQTAAALPSSGQFKAGDVGISLPTVRGEVWLYGDSYIGRQMVRNAVTLNGSYRGTIPAPSPGTWFWPGTAFMASKGKVVVYGLQMARTGGSSPWDFKTVGAARAVIDPTNPAGGKVRPLPHDKLQWVSAAARDSKGTLLYAIDGRNRAHAGRPRPDGTVKEVAATGAWIGNQFSVVKDWYGNWWMVGQLPYLSRRVVAYPLSGPAGKVTGPALELYRLPDPGPNRINYATSVHPELNGLLTWAANGTGPGTPYGLQRRQRFWPYSLAVAQLTPTLPAGGHALAATVARVEEAAVRLATAVSQPAG